MHLDLRRHERMHLTLKSEAAEPAAPNFLQQQARFDGFLERFKPRATASGPRHARPGELYTTSPRPYRGLPDLAEMMAFPTGFDHFLTRDYLLEIAAARSKWRRSALLMADV